MTARVDRSLRIAVAVEGLRDLGLTETEIAEHLGVTVPDTTDDVLDYASELGPGDVQLPPTVTLDDLIEHAHASLRPNTANTYATSLRFLAKGWSIAPGQRDDAARVLSAAGMKVPDFAELPRRAARRKGAPEELVMWPGFGDAPAGTVRRGAIDIAIPQQRAATLVECARRDRNRAARGLPSLGWTGDQAVEHLVAASAWMFKVLRGSSVVGADVDPTKDVDIPERGDCNRRENTDEELLDIFEALQQHSPDPELAVLLGQYFLWTSNRPVAAYTHDVGGIDLDRCTMTSRTKYRRVHTVPAPEVLLRRALDLAARRGSTAPHDPLFVTKNRGKDSDHNSRLDHNSLRRIVTAPVQEKVAWAGEQRWTPYWLRHTAKARIQHIGGPDCAVALLDHRAESTLEMYGRAGIEKVSWAVSVMTGHPHPLAVAPSHAVVLP